jgi:hypothetical protein
MLLWVIQRQVYLPGQSSITQSFKNVDLTAYRSNSKSGRMKVWNS